jgi:hypothetical protein
MKLIFEMIDGRPYLYLEDGKHHRRVEPRRAEMNGGSRLNPTMLDEECWLGASQYGDNFYFVFDVKKPKNLTR